jgi:hypothetical protein
MVDFFDKAARVISRHQDEALSIMQVLTVEDRIECQEMPFTLNRAA